MDWEGGGSVRGIDLQAGDLPIAFLVSDEGGGWRSIGWRVADWVDRG